MTVLRNNFGGTPGVTVTTGNSGGDGNVFDTVVDATATNTILQYTSAADLSRPTAEVVLEFSNQVQTSRPSVGWTTSMGALSEVWARFYMRIPSFPGTAEGNKPQMFAAYSGTTHVFGIGFNDEILFYPFIFSNAGTDMVSPAIQTGKWVRFEAHAVISTTVGLVELRYFADPNADGETPTATTSVSGNLGASTVDSYMFGMAVDRKHTPQTFLSNVAVSSEGWIGPAPWRIGKGVPMMNLPPAAAPHQHTW